MRIAMSEQKFRQNNSIIRNNAPPSTQQRSSVTFSGNTTKFTEDKYFRWLGNMNGFHQRAALGVCALIFQPIIDYNNPMADEKTRKFSVLKTIVKAVVGTAVGLVVRYSAMKIAEKMLANPQKFISKIKNKETADRMKEIFADKKQKDSFLGAFGSVLGLIGVACTDFTFDMPLARFAIKFTADKFGMSEKAKSEAAK